MEYMQMVQQLEKKIQNAFEQSVTMEDAEKLAAEFLYAQLQISAALRLVDLDVRMRKTGLKAIKATIYMETASSGEKKPTEAFIQATIDKHEIVQRQQDEMDVYEVDKAELERLYDVFNNAHIFFRGIAKGSMNG